jgi:DNA polymerase I-like protein with 3'-5' exonuclease and polymerase domains
MKLPTTVDFESHPAEQRPHYPPKPVSVSIRYPGRKSKFLHWGHPDDPGDKKPPWSVREELADVWREARRNGSGGLLFHRANFDLDVAETYLDLKPPPWDRVHDTLFTLFLRDPHSPDLKLKPSAERYLGMEPVEQDAVREWLIQHKVIPRDATAEMAARNIWRTPASVVGPYARGDTDRTLALHQKLHPQLDAGERVAYDRERKLMLHLFQNERQGLRVDLPKLEADLVFYEMVLATVEADLRKALKAPSLEFDKLQEVGDALAKTKIVTNWVWTKGGANRKPQRSMAKDNLGPERFNSPSVAAKLGYRTRLHTVLANSMRPWYDQAIESGGFIYTQWNQVRRHDEERKESRGARTGRVTASRFLNVSKNWLNKGDGFIQPEDLPPLPLVRKYVLPDPGEVWDHEDWKQQEFRIAAHYEDGELAEKYRTDPEFDIHVDMRRALREVGYPELADVDRVIIKNFNHGILYFEGIDLLMVKTKMARDDVIELRQAMKSAHPDLEELKREVIYKGKCGEYIRTWGGRRYFCEPPAVAKKGPRKGEEVTFEYKMFSYLIQGSAADAVKEALCRYFDTRRDSRLLNTVYDEINISAPPKAVEREDKNLKRCMEGLEFDVPMPTERKMGKVDGSWGELEKV